MLKDQIRQEFNQARKQKDNLKSLWKPSAAYSLREDQAERHDRRRNPGLPYKGNKGAKKLLRCIRAKIKLT